MFDILIKTVCPFTAENTYSISCAFDKVPVSVMLDLSLSNSIRFGSALPPWAGSVDAANRMIAAKNKQRILAADIRRMAYFLVIYTQTASFKKEFHNNVYKPEPNEYNPYYYKYISLVGETDIRATFVAQPDELRAAVAPLPEEKGTFAYYAGKWTIKEVLSHLIDGERIFAYRMLRISRGDETPLEGFEQDGYIENSNANHRSFSDLLDEFGFCRKANALMLNNLNSDALARVGTASGSPGSVRALANICIGHVRHHLAILEERYF